MSIEFDNLKPLWQAWVRSGDNGPACAHDADLGCIECCPCEDCQEDRLATLKANPEYYAKALKKGEA